MGFFPYLNLEEDDVRQLWVAMNRAEAWCNADMSIRSADINMMMQTGATAEDILDGSMPALELLGEGFIFGVENDIPGGMAETLAMYFVEEWLKDQDEYRLLDIDTLQENVPYSLLYAELFTGVNVDWCTDDMEVVAAHPSLIDTANGLRSYADKVLKAYTYDAEALDTAGFISYKSAYEAGTTDFENYVGSNDDDTVYEGDRGELEDLQWMNYQMEFYGILDGMLQGLDRDDCEIEVRFAMPVSAVNLAGEMWMESDGLGQLLHAMFKIFVYYPFDREFHQTYIGLSTEHTCADNKEDYSDPLRCDPTCRDDCGELRCGKKMLITEAN